MDTPVIIALVATGVTMLFGIGVINHYAKNILALMKVLVDAFADGALTSAEIETIIEAAKNVAKKETSDGDNSDD